MKYVTTKNAPEALGPYSQATRVGDTLYCSGQIGIDPNTNEMVEGGVIAQANQVFKNITAVLAAVECTPSDIAKVDIYLADIDSFSEVNEAYAAWLGESRPARATVEVSKLPKGALIELSCIAHSKEQ